MKGFGWLRGLRLLPPSDKEFYEIFDAMAGKLVEASGLVVDLVAAKESDGQSIIAERLKRMETECDGLVARTINLLDVAPQPPFDRDDITHLIGSLDDIMDWMEQFASRYVIYRLHVREIAGLAEVGKLADVVQASCQQVRGVISNLRKRHHIDAGCKSIHEFEAQADEIHHRALAEGIASISGVIAGMAELARIEQELSGSDHLSQVEAHGFLSRIVGVTRDNRELCIRVFHFFLQREVMKALERASDACDTVATTLKRMVMKNV